MIEYVEGVNREDKFSSVKPGEVFRGTKPLGLSNNDFGCFLKLRDQKAVNIASWSIVSNAAFVDETVIVTGFLT